MLKALANTQNKSRILSAAERSFTMKYKNPVLRGFYPDPSVCAANGKYYMVCSTFQYFPGVPVFESDDLVNWKQVGSCLTRKSQVDLEKCGSSAGVFAATIRFSNGRFYMVTTNTSANKNFYVWTDNIYGEWSDPVYVDRDGIDPSLYFENGRTFFISNGTDDFGESGIVQCEIDIGTGKKLSSAKVIWKGSGGRYLESPHLYKIGNYYYLMAAEGGTEYGHMITYARSSDIWGEYVGYEKNPVLTNKNLGGYVIQGVGHGDLIQDKYGDWHIMHLGFRQSGQWSPYHHLGRESFLSPVTFDENGWFTAGSNGVTVEEFETKGDFSQQRKNLYTFDNTAWKFDWCYLRHPSCENYELCDDRAVLRGTDITLDEADSPTFIGIRQIDFDAVISVDVSVTGGIGGISLYMDENHHYDLYAKQTENGLTAVEKLNIGDIKSVEHTAELSSDKVRLIVKADNFNYHFYISENKGDEIYLGSAQTRYLSTEVASGFTGVVIGLFAVGDGCKAEFTNFKCEYK